MKIVFINNYPMDGYYEQWKKIEQPGHHLWGATQLHQYGIDVDILPHEKYGILKKISSQIKVLGDLDQQLRIFFRQAQYDLVYSGCQYNTFLLSILRSIGIFRKPLVAIIHHPSKSILKNQLIWKILYGGHDKFVCLSTQVKKQLEDEFDVPKQNLYLLEWGVDLSFYDVENQALGYEPALIISSGKTYRDHDTLVKAFIDQYYHLLLYCTEDSAPTISALSSNIKIEYTHEAENNILYRAYKEIIADYKKAYAVAIPLNASSNLAGLTSLLDAMAMGKAVIMTRNRYIDIDIEKEGIGIWVEQGDVKGWQQAISYLLEHPSETKEMGKRGRRLCESNYNIEAFSLGLAKVLKSVLE